MNVLQTVLLYVIPFLLVIGVVVTVHEAWALPGRQGAGHQDRPLRDRLRAARWPPGPTSRACEWRLGWLPIGGYVRFAVDDNAASIPDANDLADMRQKLIDQGRGAEIPRYFHFKPIWQRAIIVAAGPMANFLLAIVVFATMLMAFGEPVSSTRVDSVVAGSPAEAAGFQKGDVILTVNGRKVTSFQALTEKIILSSDTPLSFVVQRGQGEVPIVATPRRGAGAGPTRQDPHAGQAGPGP